jgi:hypothetical protein
MSLGLATAGALCLALAAGHWWVGRNLLGRLPRELPPSPLGRGAITRGLIVFAWHGLGLMLTMTALLLLALSRGAPADDRREVAFLVGAVYAAAALVVLWLSRRRLADLLRVPLWAVFVAVAALCWTAALSDHT